MICAERNPFARALLAATLESYQDISEEENLRETFSPAFERKIAKINKNFRKDIYRPVVTAIRRAILIAAIIAAVAITAMAVPAIREAVVRFFIKDAGTHYEFTFDPVQAATAPDQIEKIYKPEYIPEGFVADAPIISTGACMYTWFSENGDCIVFDQYVIPQGETNSGPNAEGTEIRTLNLNGYEVFCVVDYGVIYHWTDNEYFYQLYCDPCVTEEERNKIFFSIGIDKTAILP